MLKNWWPFLAMYAAPAVLFLVFAERAETTGCTEIVPCPKNLDGTIEDNYAVFRKGRYVYIITGLAPLRILKRDGQIVIATTVFKAVLPVTLYTPATPAEEALWRRYFSD